MYLWKLQRNDVDYNETAGLIIAADTELRAREIAHDEAAGGQSPDAWFNPSVEVTSVGMAAEGLGSGIILTDYLRG